ncbi:hypothetical protein PVK06_007579 [Gossypium arboreum]|uniref:Uncharacterized protein n=1 Tax=Gossypium arboreum TaxID=29729 RepID=A0ABR0QIW8_GOSAR|nr:hypothetical protein PVK06_007579 [Gossypium arboreum]
MPHPPRPYAAYNTDFDVPRNQKELFQILRARPLGVGRYIDWTALEQVQLVDDVRALLTTDPWELFFEIIESTYLELTFELFSTFYVQDVMTNFDDPGIVQCRLGGLVHQLSVPKFERHRRGAISIGSYVIRLDRHFGLLNTAAQSSSLTLIGQMSLQGISSMLHMRMIEKCQGTHPPQYRLGQSTEEEDPEDIIDDIPPRHEDPNPSSQPSPPHRPVHVATSYTDISECLTRFEQQCFRCFDNIDATL